MERRRPPRPPNRPLVLLADGHADTRELYAVALRCFGFETATVSDGEDAYSHAWQTHPDIIVTEVSLPGLDGWDFIRDVKRDPRTRDIPVVIVTSDARSPARERATREGCAAFLVKPCLPDQLATELRGVLYQTPANAGTAPSR
jgi:two-component system cell cycle response regulator DivK